MGGWLSRTCSNAKQKVVIPFRSFSVSGDNSIFAGKDGSDKCVGSSRVSASTVPLSEGEILQSSNVKSFTFNELKAATRNFRPDSVLGEGGFGSVFKGWVDENTLAPSKPGSGMVIAVKRLNKEGLQGHREWLAEVKILGQLNHPNLVKLIGYCLEDEQRLLVYEFMSRGSLENHLFRRGNHFQPLPWNTRLKIALGAAKGLAFLHSAEATIIYRDFKTANILMDSDYNAKLSDFGLAKDGPTGDKSHVSTRVMGTHGYAAPEYLATGHLTTKSDVYSFGVVLLELLSGKRALDSNRPTGEQKLVAWAKPYLNNKRKIFHVLDPRLDGQYSSSGVQGAAFLALQCLSSETRHRPNMNEVVQRLEELKDMKVTSGNLRVGQKEERVFRTVGKSNSSTQGQQNDRSQRRSSHESSGNGKQEQTVNGQVTTYPRPSASPLYA